MGWAKYSVEYGRSRIRYESRSVNEKHGEKRHKCISCGCSCWRSDVSYCWDCYKYQMYESR